MSEWTPAFGAWADAQGVCFRVWAPAAQRIELIVERTAGATIRKPLATAHDGTCQARLAEVAAGDRDWYLLDGRGPFPDPASRFQPDGVHGPSEVIDPSCYRWYDERWSGLEERPLVVYELHVGTFSPAGTFVAAVERLPYLQALGVTAVELMPVAEFAGERNWGYDGAALFAPAHCYGRPDDLRRFVDAAHATGLSVLLDVVYNHLGPDGAYLAVFSPSFFSTRHRSPWGAGINFDGPESGLVRSFLIENALHWVHEYHIDGLRLDATHAIVDDSPRHFLADLAAAVHAAQGRPRLVIAEDDRNLAILVRPESEGGLGLDGVWADDFHHQTRRMLAGDSEGYYRDFTSSIDDLARIAGQGWLYTGQPSVHFGGPRGTDPAGVPLEKFVVCLQNHDQVGNRAFGERLHHQIDLAAYRAAVALLLVLPSTPLLFMGQEWAATTPFLYFTAHERELGQLVTDGRRKEFAHFSAFADAGQRERIPDPQAAETFQRSRLDWSECEREPHATTLRLCRRLLALRRDEPALRSGGRGAHGATANDQTIPRAFYVTVLDDDTLGIRRDEAGTCLAAVIRLRGAGTVRLDAILGPADPCGRASTTEWSIVLTTEDPPFAIEPAPPQFERTQSGGVARFQRPAAILLRATYLG